jgi:hypothetical protein
VVSIGTVARLSSKVGSQKFAWHSVLAKRASNVIQFPKSTFPVTVLQQSFNRRGPNTSSSIGRQDAQYAGFYQRFCEFL